MVGPKKQDFWPRINVPKGKKNKDPSMNYGLSKSAKINFQSQFSMSKIDGIKKKISLMKINLGDHFVLKTFFSNFNF